MPCAPEKSSLPAQSFSPIWSRGFTLVEIISVMILLAIVAAVVITRAGGTSMTAYADADRLVSDLRYAQSLSMTHAYDDAYANGTVDQVTVYVAADGWGFDPNQNWRFADGKRSRNLKWTDSISGPSSISFRYPFGDLASAGNQNLTLTKGEQTITVTIYAQTGYVEINQ